MKLRLPPHILLIAILALTVAVFYPTLNNGLVNWDDPAYIQKNDLIKDLSLQNIAAIFSTFINSNYQPLTVLTFALETHFFDINPFIIHFNNLLLHLLNITLVYLFVRRLCQEDAPALIACLLFAIHPMRVESVAWACQRKDVLFGFFYLSGLYTYLKYIDDNRLKKMYFFALGLFLLSLLSKPTAVSFPLALILIYVFRKKSLSLRTAIDLTPFFLLSLLFGFIAILGTYTPPVDTFFIKNAWPLYLDNSIPPYPVEFNLFERFALISYCLIHYLAKVIWVTNLSCYYPYPLESGIGLPKTYYFYSAITLGLFTWSACNVRKRGIIFFGLSFFFATIAFNLPFKNFGHISLMGDRFTYIPYLGLFMIIAFTLTHYYKRIQKNSSKAIFSTAIVLFILCLSIQSWQRCFVWRNSETLWTNVIQKYPNQAMAYFNRANFYLTTYRPHLSIPDYNKAIAIEPHKHKAYLYRGMAYFKLEQHELALSDYERVIQMKPNEPAAYLRRVELFLQINALKKTSVEIQRLLEKFPNHRKVRTLEAKIKEKLNN